jgi:hypothetical protein
MMTVPSLSRVFLTIKKTSLTAAWWIENLPMRCTAVNTQLFVTHEPSIVILSLCHSEKKSPYPPRLFLLASSFTSAVIFILIAIGSSCRPCPQPGRVPPPPPARQPLLLLISKAHVLAEILYTFLHHKTQWGGAAMKSHSRQRWTALHRVFSSAGILTFPSLGPCTSPLCCS